MRIVVLSGGIGGARFLRGVLAAIPDAEVTVIGNTGDDITLHGLRICPDLDTVMYTLGGGIHEGQGWGRADETYAVAAELAAYGAEPQWFGLGDRDLATHILRTQLLAGGMPLSAVTDRLCARWRPGVRLLPMTDDPVETQVTIAGPDGPRTVHFQEYWVRLHAEPEAIAVVLAGSDRAAPAPGVLDAIATADLVLLAPSNPVVSIGPILAVSGIRDALVDSAAPVIGLSPIVGGAVVRGMADKLLRLISVATTASAVALGYGPDLLDGWLVDTVDAGEVAAVAASGIECRAVPLLMRDLPTTEAMARAALDLASQVTVG
ncbi:MAG TPA: 2-phospho-L-lactate transferase [Actinomycetes bacterium]|nr:2-phospho-L-lactate transferase [Actinomycetes bacterium]